MGAGPTKITYFRKNYGRYRIKDHGKNISIYHIAAQPFTMLDSFPCGAHSASIVTNNAESVLRFPL
jgi:hypothetical protein